MKKAFLIIFSIFTISAYAQDIVKNNDDVAIVTVSKDITDEIKAEEKFSETDPKSKIDKKTNTNVELPQTSNFTGEDQKLLELLMESKKQSKQLSTIKWIMVGSISLSALAAIISIIKK